MLTIQNKLFTVHGMTMASVQPYLLLIDDDADDREFFLDAFAAVNPAVEVQYASNGLEALKMLEDLAATELPSALLIDYQMPGLSGLALLQALQNNPRYSHITKIIWSSSQRIKDIEDCKRFGAANYLIKPSTTAELHKVVHQLTAVFQFASEKKY